MRHFRGLMLVIFVILTIEIIYLTTNLNSDDPPDPVVNTSFPQPVSHSAYQKYIRYECVTSGNCGGWADRIKGMFSTYALSLILKRKFLIEITQPCYISKVVKPKTVNWDDNSQLESLKKKPGYKQRDIHFKWDLRYAQTLEKADLINELKDYDFVSIRTGLNFLNNLSKNPYLNQTIQELGYNSTQFKLHYLLHKFYNELFKLNDNLERKHEAIRKKLKPTQDTTLICAQIRIGGKNDDRFADLSHAGEFWSFIDNYMVAKKIVSNYMIYVTSDKDQLKQEARAHFAKDHVVTMDDSSVHIDKDVLDLKDDCSSIENVILDFHLLQHCDVAVVSHSGFGLLGAWNRPVPNQELYVFTNQELLKKNYWARDNLAFVKVENLDEFFFH